MEDPTTLAKAEQNLLRKWLISKFSIFENRKKVTWKKLFDSNFNHISTLFEVNLYNKLTAPVNDNYTRLTDDSYNTMDDFIAAHCENHGQELKCAFLQFSNTLF